MKSLLAVDYPAELFEVVVVADNCTDDTADQARAAGANVMVRNNAQERGKGYALDHVFTKLFRLPDMLQTESARREAARRAAFMKEYLAQMESEMRF